MTLHKSQRIDCGLCDWLHCRFTNAQVMLLTLTKGRVVKGLDNTITEHDMEPVARQLVQGFRNDGADMEPDLTVDGLSESLLSRLFQLFTPSNN